jgi:hypothetical protein
MANTIRHNYDTSIGTNDRSVVSATKTWAIVLALVALFGIVMLTMFVMSSGSRSSGGFSSDNTATRPAEP